MGENRLRVPDGMPGVRSAPTAGAALMLARTS